MRRQTAVITIENSMKSKQKDNRIEELKEQLDELGLLEKDDSIIGYAIFHTVKRAFITFEYDINTGSPVYTGDINKAHIAESKFMAYIDIGGFPEPDKFDMAVVPLIENPLFGINVKEGAIDRLDQGLIDD